MHVEGVYDPYIQYFTIASFLSSAVYVQVIFRNIISKDQRLYIPPFHFCKPFSLPYEKL